MRSRPSSRTRPAGLADESGAGRKRLADAHSAVQHEIWTELEEEDHQQSRDDAEQNPEASHHRVQQLKAQVSTEVVTIQERIEAGLLSLGGTQYAARITPTVTMTVTMAKTRVRAPEVRARDASSLAHAACCLRFSGSAHWSTTSLRGEGLSVEEIAPP